MSRDEFREVFATAALSPTLPLDQSIRPPPAATSDSGPTMAFSSLPSVDLRGDTNPELELGDTIGEGGMGVVREAKQLALHRKVAVKTLRPGQESDGAARRLLQEALVTGAVEHPNIVPVYSLGQTHTGAPVLVMKHIEGVPWSECIADPARIPGDDVRDAVAWHLDVFADLCRAVEFAHSRGIVHRDIKPDNVMIGAYGEVYLLDWGIAVTLDPDKSIYLPHVDASPGVVGTPGYMAPEMTVGEPAGFGTHTDVYLLGASLYHALTGEPPHHGKSLFEIMFCAYESKPPRFDIVVHDELVEICHRAMAREPAERFGDVSDLRRALRAFAAHRSSIELTEKAEDRRVELVQLASVDDHQAVEASFRDVLGACRFGFGEALLLWPDNTAARVGLRATLEQVVYFEISLRNLTAAQAWLEEVDQPSPALVQAVDTLRAELEAERAELADLRRFRDDFDLSQGAGARRLGAMVAGAFFGLMPLAVEFFIDTAAVTNVHFLMHSVVVGGFLLIVAVVLRKDLLANQANRRIVRLLLAYVAWTFVFRFVALVTDIPWSKALTLEMTGYGLAFAAVAIISDWLAWFGFTIYAIAAVLAALFPDNIFIIAAVANVAALSWLAWIWNDQRRRGGSIDLRASPDDENPSR